MARKNNKKSKWIKFGLVLAPLAILYYFFDTIKGFFIKSGATGNPRQREILANYPDAMTVLSSFIKHDKVTGSPTSLASMKAHLDYRKANPWLKDASARYSKAIGYSANGALTHARELGLL